MPSPPFLVDCTHGATDGASYSLFRMMLTILSPRLQVQLDSFHICIAFPKMMASKQTATVVSMSHWAIGKDTESMQGSLSVTVSSCKPSDFGERTRNTSLLEAHRSFFSEDKVDGGAF